MKKKRFYNLIILLLFIISISRSTPQTKVFEQQIIVDTAKNQPKVSIIYASAIVIDDYNPSSGWDDCPYVNGTGIIIDPYILQNLVVTGSVTHDCLSIANSAVYFKILNCTFFNATYSGANSGISLVNVQNGLITNNTFYDITNIGLNLPNDNSNIVISNNTFIDNANWGCCVQDSELILVENNTFMRNYGYGLNLNNAQNVTISHNLFDSNGGGLDLWSQCYNVTITKNTVLNNDHMGIEVMHSNLDTIVQNNTVIGNENGINIGDSNRTLIQWNQVQDSIVMGIRMLNDGSFNHIRNNTITQSGDHGFWLTGCNNTVESNTATFNGMCGFTIVGGTENVVSFNTFNDNSGSGIGLGDYCTKNIIRYNTCMRNTFDGIDIWETCTDNVVTDNILIDNGNCIQTRGNTATTNTIANNQCDSSNSDDTDPASDNDSSETEGSLFQKIDGYSTIWFLSCCIFGILTLRFMTKSRRTM